jgi:DNA replication protein DnaC
MEQIKTQIEAVKQAINNNQTPVIDQERRTLTSDQNGSLTGVKPYECETCSDTGMVIVETGDERYPRTAKRCECRVRRIIENAIAAIPQEIGVPKLAELRPAKDLHPVAAYARHIENVQAQAINAMQSAPEDDYLFCGENGTGKTHLAYALYLHALFAGRRVMACTVQELLDEFKAMELGKVGRDGQPFRPRVTPEDLRQNSEKWTLLIDDFVQARVTEFTCEMLCALLDAAWKYGHQLIVTSNKNVDDLIQRWSRVDEVYGRTMAKRLTAKCMCVELFFDGLSSQ